MIILDYFRQKRKEPDYYKVNGKIIRRIRGGSPDIDFSGATNQGPTFYVNPQSGDNSSSLQSVISNCSSSGGGRIYPLIGIFGFASPVVVGTRNITIKGFGGKWRSNPSGTPSTTFLGLTPGMTIIQFAPTGGIGDSDSMGGGLEGVFLDCEANNAAIGLEVLSWRYGNFKWISANIATTASIHAGVVPSTNWTSTDHRDIQKCIFEQIDIGTVGTNNPGFCLLLDGDTAGGSPTEGDFSTNEIRDLLCNFNNGDAVHIGNSDNNVGTNWHLFRQAGGTGFATFFGGGAAAGTQSRAWTIIRYTANAPTKVEGTDTATVAAGTPCFYGFDKDNNTPDPTVGTGASFFYIDNLGIQMNPKLQGAFAGGTRNELIANAPIAGSALTLMSGGSNHLQLIDGTRQGRFILTANGPTIGRIVGGNYVDIDSGLQQQGTVFHQIAAKHVIASDVSSVPATSNLGANVTSVTPTGNDFRGKMVIVMGGALAANTRICTVTYGTAFAGTPILVMLVNMTSGAGLAIVNFYSSAEAAGSFDLFADQALAAGTYTLKYLVIQ